MNRADIATLDVEREGDVVFATLAGEIDPSNARELARRLREAVPNDAMMVVLDMSRVAYLHSSGVQLMFELAERLRGRQQALAVVVPPGAPSRPVLEIVAFEDTAPVVATREEALAQRPV